jgi:Carboxypeptidase regulatory-like domain
MLRFARNRRRGVHGVFLALMLTGVAGMGCQSPLDEESEPQTWWLELEQLDDGSRAAYPRRGTITMRLRADTTAQQDPECQGRPASEQNITAFLADVEAFGSRLQEAASGSADGSWNCHGFRATVRLSDGTTYDLRSDEPGRPFSYVFPEEDTWTAGQRRGRFKLRDLVAGSTPKLRESHFDLLVHNRGPDDMIVALSLPRNIHSPLVIQYGLPLDPDPHAFDHHTVEKLFFAEAAANATTTLSWPSHENRRTSWASSSLESFTVAFSYQKDGMQGASFATCYLGPDHPDQVHLNIDKPTWDGIECGVGWWSQETISVARTRLFILAGAAPVNDTVTVFGGYADSVFVSTSDPSITASIDEHATGSQASRLLTLTVAANAPRRHHLVVVTARHHQPERVAQVELSVYVYELSATLTPDTLVIKQGRSATTTVQIERLGIVDDVALSITTPSGITGSFSEPTVAGPSTTLTVTVDPATAPGIYDLTLCAASAYFDPNHPCRNVPLTVNVGAANRSPVVTIHNPTDGSQVTQGTAIAFQGSAMDPEDGALSGAAMAWTSDRDGTLGTGTDVTRNDLSVGTHVITLTGTDSDGASSAASISITVQGLGTATIEGVVQVPGAGIPGVTVNAAGPVSQTTQTDATGHYSLSGLPAGTYTVTISNIPGPYFFPTTSRVVTLTAGETLTVSFTGTGG